MAVVVQTDFPNNQPKGYAGMVANGEVCNIISRSVEDADGLAFGAAAFRGANDKGCTGTPAAGTFLGVATTNTGQVQNLNDAVDIYPQYTTAGLLNEGSVFVVAGEAADDGDDVFITPAGAFVTTATNNVAIPAKFDETVAAGDIVSIRVTRS